MNPLAWWNLVFLLPGSMGIMLALLSAIGLGSEGESDHDVAADHDVDVDADHDIDADHALHHDVPAQLEAHHDLDGHDHDHDHDLQPGHGSDGLLSSTLTVLGVGRAPTMVVLTILSLLFGFLGFTFNQMLSPWLPVNYFFPLSFVAAGASSAVLTGGMARLFGRLVPKEESYATTFDALEGQTGRIVLLRSPTEGYAQIRDRFGNLQEVRCRSLEGQPLQKDQPILIVRAQSQERLCLVIHNELEDRALPS